MALFEQAQAIEQQWNVLKEQTQTYRTLTEKKLGYFPNIESLNSSQQELTFNNPIQFNLIQLVMVLDGCLYWIYLARNCQLFEQPDTFFQLKKEYTRNVLHRFSQIAAISLKKLPRVTIEDYHNQTEIYQQAKVQNGDSRDFW